MQADALDRTMAFAMEADRLKSVERANVLTDNSRPENAAEHSWHLALAAMTMATHGEGADIDRAIAMALVHDLVEIDAGDHPVHLPADGQADAERRAADRLFAMHPGGPALRALWDEFEDAATPTARYLKRLDHLLPALQVLWNPAPPADHLRIAGHTLTEGRAAPLQREWPEAHAHALSLLAGESPAAGPLADRMTFLAEADRLKTVTRATRLTDGSRFENSAEHSWHLALMALTLSPWSGDADDAEAIRMLVLHDVIEIDAGDLPVFAAGWGGADKAAEERAAADRLFGYLPDDQGTAFRTLWDAFEADETPTARWAKALDRFQPPNLNLANGGGSWVDYDVSEDQVRARVGTRIARGAPDLWDWLSPRIAAHFAAG
ncbi:HD domain-containing protein [Jannaschia aquimarina]|uniref:5'-nucleotidase n=1 Tax=Jannaschia aquimarina TaxID=935700 RepID=A0A0D1CPZ1_9RHOB|nr:HD domain-containing protein [Jannaschia aquimarina]KIT16807.1 5'-nucleotidase [Jannaschia aquimarina]SNT13793.1 putative hydrolases of HD superfamily [Jannaschia aquimarina]